MSRCVIISCGSKKLKEPAEAYRLYIGSYFISNLKWALSVVELDNIFILSAKHGLIPSHEVIAPYDLKMKSKGSVPVFKIRSQVKSLKIVGMDIVALGGSAYLTKLRSVIPLLKTPCEGMGLGYQISCLKKNRGKWP